MPLRAPDQACSWRIEGLRWPSSAATDRLKVLNVLAAGNAFAFSEAGTLGAPE